MTQKIICVFFILASIFTQSVSGQILEIKINKQANTLYDKLVLSVQVKADFVNPFFQEQVALDLELVSPKGKSLILPCFYKSGVSGQISNWEARFTPQEAGVYSYQFKLKQANKKDNTSKKANFNVSMSNKKGFLHAGNNWAFKFDNQELFRGIGENICWESRATDDSKFFKDLHQDTKFNYEYFLRSLAQSGGNYFRTWMCSWNFPLEYKNNFNNNRYQNSDQYFNPSAALKLDRMLELSDSLGVYVMLTLDFMGNYSGEDWKRSIYNKANGGSAVSASDFFENKQAKTQYKNRLRYLIARWGCFTSLGAWEFFNEIDNLMYADSKNTIPAESIVEWHKEMSQFFKQFDPYKHLVTTSISHRDLPGLNAIESMDFNQKHIYKNNFAIPKTIADYTENHKKPYVIGEFGYEWDWNKNFDEFPLEMDNDFKRGLWLGLFSATPILPLSWWWEYFDNHNLLPYLANVKTISDKILKESKGEIKIIKTGNKEPIHCQAVDCQTSTFAYLYNKSNRAQAATIELELSSIKEVQLYDCETGLTTKFNNFEKIGNQYKFSIDNLYPYSDIVLIIKHQ